MTCDTIRQRLLASERPDQPARAEAAHLAGCAGCRDWLARLARLERMLPLLPVPPCAPPLQLMAMLQAALLRPLVTRPPNLYPSARPRREGGRQKLALSLSLAATLALFALGWWALAPTPGAPPTFPKRSGSDPLIAGNTPQERVIALVDWAEDLLDEARAQPNDVAAVAAKARDFRQLVEQKLWAEADKVSIGDRPTVLMPIAVRSSHAEKKANSLANAWQFKHPAAAKELRRIAHAADKANRRLRHLIEA